MKKTIKKVTAIVLSMLMILTCIPDFVELGKAANETINEVTFGWNEKDDTEVKAVLLDGYLQYYGGSTFNNVATFGEDTVCIQYAISYSNGGVLSTTEECSDTIDNVQLGETYYIKAIFTANNGYEFSTNTKAIVDGSQELDEYYTYYSSNLKYVSDTVVEVVYKIRCATVLDAYSYIKIPELKPSSKPGDFNDSDYSVKFGFYSDHYGDGNLEVLTGSVVDVNYYGFYADDFLNENDTFGIDEYVVELTVDYSSFENVITGFDPNLFHLAFNNVVEDPIVESSSRANKNYWFLGGVIPGTVEYQTDDKTMKVDYYIGTLREIKDVKVENLNLDNPDEQILTLKFEGVNLPEYFSVVTVCGEYSSIEEFKNEENPLILCEGYYAAGSCAEMNNEYTECIFDVFNENTGYVITGDEKITIYVETDLGIGEKYFEVLKTFSLKEEPAPVVSHTTKKYTAKNVDTTSEKISGSGKKGSKRTITPIEGKKVGRVTVTDKDGNKVDVTKNEDGTYSFIQPASNVEVEVTYVNREITLTIGSTEADVDGERSNLDVSPVIRNDRTMLPIRFVAENLGAKVEWDEKKPDYVLIIKGDIKIEITLGSDTMLVNGKEVKLDSVAFAENDRTYLPVRAVSENLNAIVEWNELKPMEVKIYER